MSCDPDRLVEGYLDGTLAPTEQAELDRRLCGEPALRRELLLAAGLEDELRRVLQAQAVARWRRFRQKIIPLGVAALILMQLGGWLWVNRVGAMRSGRPVAATRLPQPVVMGSVVAFSGDAALIHVQTGEVWQPVRTGRVVRAGDRLRVGTNAVVVFRYADDSQLQVYGLSDLTFSATNGAKRVWLRAGALDATIVPQPAGQPMEVATVALSAIVQDSEFRLLLDDQAGWLGVRHGKVDAVRASDRQRVVLADGRYVATAEGWPFSQMPTTCPYWRAQCVAKTGVGYR